MQDHGISCPLPFLLPFQQHLILMLNFCALGPGCQGSGRWREGHVIVMTGVWDESQYHKHVFIMTLLLSCLSSGESESPGQTVINFHNSFQGRWGATCQRPEGHFLCTLPSTLPAASQLLLVPSARWIGCLGLRLLPRASLPRRLQRQMKTPN